MKYKNKIIACSFDYHSYINIKGNHKYILIDDANGESKNFTKTKDNKKILSESSNISPDIIIDNCEIKYCNKNIIAFNQNQKSNNCKKIELELHIMI